MEILFNKLASFFYHSDGIDIHDFYKTLYDFVKNYKSKLFYYNRGVFLPEINPVIRLYSSEKDYIEYKFMRKNGEINISKKEYSSNNKEISLENINSVSILSKKNKTKMTFDKKGIYLYQGYKMDFILNDSRQNMKDDYITNINSLIRKARINNFI